VLWCPGEDQGSAPKCYRGNASVLAHCLDHNIRGYGRTHPDRERERERERERDYIAEAAQVTRCAQAHARKCTEMIEREREIRNSIWWEGGRDGNKFYMILFY